MGQEGYYFNRVGGHAKRPIFIVVKGSFSSAEFVAATDLDPGITVTRASLGVYNITGLPKAKSYTVIAQNLLANDLTPSGTEPPGAQVVIDYDASAGTANFVTRQASGGTLVSPSDTMQLHMVIMAEVG